VLFYKVGASIFPKTNTSKELKWLIFQSLYKRKMLIPAVGLPMVVMHVET